MPLKHSRVAAAIIALVVAPFALAQGTSEKKSEPKKESARPTQSRKFVNTQGATGEVLKVDASADPPKLTFRVTWFTVTRGRTGGPMKQVHTRDYTLPFAGTPEVKSLKIPRKAPKADGTPQQYTADELQKLKGNTKLPGFAKQLSDLQPGMIVELHLVRDANDRTEKPEDRLISWILIVNDDAKPTVEAKK